MRALSFSEISNRLKKFFLPETDLVIGIGRGGIVPASLVAFKLNCALHILHLNYRDDSNNPRYETPQLLSKEHLPDLTGKRILLVDDVSVSGKTLNAAQEILNHPANLKTFVFKGHADFVLLPEINTCVNWPWSIQ